MGNYNLYCRGEFDNIKNVRFRVDILKLDYSGPVAALIFGKSPVIHKWNEDDCFAPVRGSSLTLNIINVEGQLPINAFYSDNDIEFKVEFSAINPDTSARDYLFYGFLVQADFLEIMVDYNHPFTLSANDNLGLLKDVALDYRADVSPTGVYNFFESVTVARTAPHTYTLTNTNYQVKVGDTFSFTNGGSPYIIIPTAVTVSGGTQTVTVAATITTAGAVDGFVYSQNIFDPLERQSLLSMIQVCLHNTNLDLYTSIYANLFEISFFYKNSFLQQTYIDPQTFYGGDSYQSCWQVLTDILGRFRLSLFQAYGEWHIVRWDEIKEGIALPYYRYTATMTLYSTGTLDNGFSFGFGEETFPEYGVNQTIVRPYLSTRETFDYNPAHYILKNNDFQVLGTLIREYTTGSGLTINI